MALVFGAACVAVGVYAPFPDLVAVGLVAGGATLILVALLMTARAQMQSRARFLASQFLAGFIEKDAVPSFVTDEDGEVQASNDAANSRFHETRSATLAGTLRSIFANPSAILYRLQGRARRDGAAREDVVTRGGHMRLAVHRLGSHRFGSRGWTTQGFLWRIEEIPDRGGPARGGDAIPMPMLTVGRSGAVLFMNEAARGLIGERVKAIERLFESMPPRPGEVNIINTLTGKVNVNLVELEASGGRSELFLLPVPDGFNAASQTAIESLPVPMIKVSTAGEILTINGHAGRLLGKNAKVAMQLGQVMEGLGRAIPDWLDEAAKGKSATKSEFLRLTREDKEVFVQVTLSPVKEEGKTVLVAMLNDATELKTLEAQFVQSQKMQAIGQLAGGVAHDFNNLLTAISGHCDLLLLRHDQGDQDYGDLVQINENSNRAAALVGQLLAFSRKQTLRPEVLDLRDTLADLTHLLNRLVGEKVTLTLSHEPVLGSIRADKRQLEQVLMNLVVNARDAMPDGGEIRIETEIMTLSQPLERDRATVPVGDYVTLRVTDHGTGIPPDKIQKIFEPFFTTKRVGEGTGLGLSTAYGIVKQTGGFIFVDSVVGSGTEFILYFPTHEAVKTKQLAAPAQKPRVLPQQGEGVVLLVEDEAPVRAFASRALRLRGYTVLEAESAEDALRTLEDPTLSVDVFVTDVVMPGMDGPTWVREALKTRPNVRVVFVSGYAEGAFGDNKPHVSNANFLPKPFSLNQLTDIVHQQMHPEQVQ
ncbi:MAG: ATP-binding protein [Rhodobacteraceae bacterium]|nr:ATP-binding protein [Paracoccaceae bacterium]